MSLEKKLRRCQAKTVGCVTLAQSIGALAMYDMNTGKLIKAGLESIAYSVFMVGALHYCNKFYKLKEEQYESSIK